jgi:flagellar basal-body rod protein FlgB
MSRIIPAWRRLPLPEAAAGAGKFCRAIQVGLPARPPDSSLHGPGSRCFQGIGWGGTLAAHEWWKPSSQAPDTIMYDKIDAQLKVQRHALNLLVQRQEMLASNIANADTPHFKARDIDFNSALASALGGAGADSAAPLEMARTNAGHLAGEGAAPYGAAVKYRTEYMGAVDGNTVNMDIERAAFTENAMHMEALMSFVSSSLRTMNSAIQGQ